MRFKSDTPKVLAICLIVTAALICSSACFAEQIWIGTVNLSQVLSKSVKVKKFQDEINRLRTDSESKLEAIRSGIKSLRTKLEEGKDKLPDAEKKALEDKIKAQIEKYNTEKEAMDVALKFKARSDNNLIRSEIDKTIDKLAQKRGLNVIIPARFMLYRKGVPEITDELIAELDKSENAKQPAAKPAEKPKPAPQGKK